MSAEPIDYAAVKAEHEGHWQSGNVCLGGREHTDGAEHCLPYRLAVEAERLKGVMDEDLSDRNALLGQIESLVGKVARVEARVEYWRSRAFVVRISEIDAALAGQPEQVQP